MHLLTTLAIATSTAATPDARHPVYVIAHCANDIERVDEAIMAGANGVEIDVPIRDGRLLGLHGGLEPRECGARTNPDELAELFRHVAAAMDQGELGLVVVDAKETEGQERRWGRLLGEAMGDAELEPQRVLVSIPASRSALVLRGLDDADYAPRVDLYWDDYGAVAPAELFDVIAASDADAIGVGMDPIGFWRPMSWWTPWLQEMATRRDSGSGPSFTYYWTLNLASSARVALDHHVDGLITNHPERIVPLFDEAAYRDHLRLATSRDELP